MASPGVPPPPKKDKLEIQDSVTPTPQAPRPVHEVEAKREGNKIYANSKDDWESVSSIEVGGEKFKFERTTLKLDFDVQLCPNRSIDVFDALPPITASTYESNLAARIRCDAVLPKAKYSRVEPYTQRATRGTESDSGDEGAEDEEIPSVFTVEELTFFHRDLGNLHKRYYQAKFVNFQNAYGKFFYKKLCEFLLPASPFFECLISANPKGKFQPWCNVHRVGHSR